MNETITITSGSARAEIALLGAELLSLYLDGQALLWEADAAFWAGTSPILFPIIGRANDGTVRVDGETYPMPPHGFASQAKFAIEEQTSDRVVLCLVDSEESRQFYPFSFALKVTYVLTPTALQITFNVTNTGRKPMPYSIGFHPGFRWPFAHGAKDSYGLQLPASNAVLVSRLTSSGLMEPSRSEMLLSNGRLPLTEELFSSGALCLLDLHCTSASFVAADGSAIMLSWENFPHLALWAKAGAPFLCIESWTGYSDPLGFAKNLAEKPSVLMLEPAASNWHRICLGAHFAEKTKGVT